MEQNSYFKLFAYIVKKIKRRSVFQVKDPNNYCNMVATNTVPEYYAQITIKPNICTLVGNKIAPTTSFSWPGTGDVFSKWVPIESTKTMSMEDVSTWVLEKIKNI